MRKMHALFCLFIFMVPSLGCKPEEDRLRDMKAADAVPPPQEPDMPDQIAKVGVGLKGNSLDDINGNDPRLLLAGPVKAYFNAREKIVFEIQLPQSANLFNALNSRNPKTHEEYMKEVVGPIQLPQLPTGMVYKYHPDTNDLWVEKEKQ